MTYSPRPPCSRCGRYERMQGMYVTCTACDDEAIGRWHGDDLATRREASGWNEANTVYDRPVWVEPPQGPGEPGVMAWRKPTPKPVSFAEEQRRDALRRMEYGEPINHVGQHDSGCVPCHLYDKSLVRRVTR